MQTPSISIIIPAFNEAGNIEAAAAEITAAVNSQDIRDYEIMLFDDGSIDGTGKIADALADQDVHIRVIHNAQNMGLGYNYKKGIELAKKEYLIMIHGDNEILAKSIDSLLSSAGRRDIIIPYTDNPQVRPYSRRIISRIFVRSINLLFGLNLRYYNGHCLISTKLLKNLPIETCGHTYMAEVLVKLIKSGHGFMEVPVYLRPRKYGRSSVLRVRTIVRAGISIIKLFWEVYFRRAV